MQNSQFNKKVSLEEHEALKEDRFLRGRQIAFMIYDYFRVTGAHDTLLDYADSFSVTRHDDNFQKFDKFYYQCQRFHQMISWKVCTIWEHVSPRNFKTVLELYDMEIHQKISMPNYQKLKTMVKRSIDQKLRLRNFDARHGRIETGAVVKNRKVMSGVERGKGICYQWKEKGQCSKGDQCIFQHESDDRAQKPDHTAATPSEPSVSRKRSIRGKGNHGPFFDNSADITLLARDHLVNIGIFPNVNSVKLNRGCKAGDK